MQDPGDKPSSPIPAWPETPMVRIRHTIRQELVKPWKQFRIVGLVL
ncbi:MAG TPA: hypothetical protein VKN14_13020 [Flavobacteriaceae bacterium]|nr:hypothetical protein [Flavobacteriaceae bacterium]